MTIEHDASGPSEFEELLPWHAAGTLSRREADRVEAALARDPLLAQRFELVREEMASTIQLNESLGAPSPRPMQKLFAAIDAEGTAAVRSPGLRSRLTEFFGSLRPQTLAWVSAAACVAIVLQAGIIADVYLSGRGGSYEVASSGPGANATVGTFALIRFTPNTTAAAITAFLEANQANIVLGPSAGGLYRVRIAASVLPQDQRDRLIAKLAGEKAVVGFIAAAE